MHTYIHTFAQNLRTRFRIYDPSWGDPVSIHVYIHIQTYIHTRTHVHKMVSHQSSRPGASLGFISTYTRTYIHTSAVPLRRIAILTCIYIHTYIHTYIRSPSQATPQSSPLQSTCAQYSLCKQSSSHVRPIRLTSPISLPSARVSCMSASQGRSRK
jgi:hypothetical protein